MKFGFKDWLLENESGTSTASIAGFARPVMGMVRRGSWEGEEVSFKKKKKKKFWEDHDKLTRYSSKY